MSAWWLLAAFVVGVVLRYLTLAGGLRESAGDRERRIMSGLPLDRWEREARDRRVVYEMLRRAGAVDGPVVRNPAALRRLADMIENG